MRNKTTGYLVVTRRARETGARREHEECQLSDFADRFECSQRVRVLLARGRKKKDATKEKELDEK